MSSENKKTKMIEELRKGNPPKKGDGIFGSTMSSKDSRIILLPVPWEATASYGKGTHLAPSRILEASHQMDLVDFAFGETFKSGISYGEEDKRIHEWNEETGKIVERIRDEAFEGLELSKGLVEKVNELSHLVNQSVYKQAKSYLSQGKELGVVGGDHSSPYGLLKALDEKMETFGILHFDAHLDLRKSYEGFDHSHASIMRNVLDDFSSVSKLISVGPRDVSYGEVDFVDAHSSRIKVFYDRELYRRKAQGDSFRLIAEEIVAQLPNDVYISFDIDGLDPRYCPSTGTPVPGGLEYNEAVYIMETLVKSGRNVVGFDLCEVGNAEWDANIGARVLYKLCGALASSKD